MGPLVTNKKTKKLERIEGDLIVKDQIFMLANVLSGGTFTQTRFDGVMGLGQGGAVGTAWYQNLVTQGSLTKPWFSIFYSNSDSQPGQLIFGGVDGALYTGPLVWHPHGPTFPFYWTCQLTGVDQNGVAVPAVNVPA